MLPATGLALLGSPIAPFGAYSTRKSSAFFRRPANLPSNFLIFSSMRWSWILSAPPFLKCSRLRCVCSGVAFSCIAAIRFTKGKALSRRPPQLARDGQAGSFNQLGPLLRARSHAD